MHLTQHLENIVSVSCKLLDLQPSVLFLSLLLVQRILSGKRHVKTATTLDPAHSNQDYPENDGLVIRMQMLFSIHLLEMNLA